MYFREYVNFYTFKSKITTNENNNIENVRKFTFDVIQDNRICLHLQNVLVLFKT